MTNQQSYPLSTSGQRVVVEGEILIGAGRPDEAVIQFRKAAHLFYQQIHQAAIIIRNIQMHYLDDLLTQYNQQLKQIDVLSKENMEIARQEYQAALAFASQEYEGVQKKTIEQVSELRSVFKWSVLPWDDPTWLEYTPPEGASPPTVVRFGRFALPESITITDLPAIIPFIGDKHLFLKGEDQVKLRQALQTTLLRQLLASPPDSLKLLLVDPVGSGVNLASFLPLPEHLRSPRVFSRQEEIAGLLDTLLRQIEEIIQDRLRNLYPTLDEYNSDNPEMALPYQVLALVDFPAGFDERMSQNLMTIAHNGPKAGVYLLVHHNPQGFPPPRNFEPQALSVLGNLLVLASDGCFHIDDHAYDSYSIIPDGLPEPQDINRCFKTYIGGIKAVDLSFRRVAIPQQQCWQGSSISGSSVPIGLNERGQVHFFELGQGTLHHVLLGGTTGSGKTNLLHVLITQLSLQYSPEEIEFFLMDLREGIAFQDYLDLPHARVVALETEEEFALNVLRQLQREMERRGQLFKAIGANTLREYRQTGDRRLARILVIIDEYQVLFGDDYIALETQSILEDLARRGREFGIHLLLSSQSPSTGGLTSARRIYDQMGVRIALKCRPDDARLILGEKNTAADHLKQSGEAIYNTDLGHSESNVRIRIALLEGERQNYLAQIKSLASGKDYPLPITFETSAPARIQVNPELLARLASSPSKAGSPVKIWLGEPIEIKNPTCAILQRYPRSNLLILGKNEEQAYGLLLATLLSLVAERDANDIRILIADFARPISPFFGLFRQLTSILAEYTIQIIGPREIGQTINYIDQDLLDRVANPATIFRDTYLIVAGIHGWRELRPEAGQFGSSKPTAVSELVLKLADEGPDYGIHLIAWCDSLNVFNQYFGRKGLDKIAQRVFLRLSDDESSELIRSKAAATLKANRALYRDDEDWESGKLEKFKPYPIPEGETLDRLLQAINRHTPF